MNARFIPDRLDVVSGFFGAHGHWTNDYENYHPHRSREWVKNLCVSRLEINGEWGKGFDCIYIDADHSYEAVVDGFRHALDLLNPEGMILFHDALQWPGVTQALKEFRTEFKGKAKVEFLDGSPIFNHPSLSSEPVKLVDGIGYFKLKKVTANAKESL